VPIQLRAAAMMSARGISSDGSMIVFQCLRLLLPLTYPSGILSP
jgi:hypothetical protein